MSTNQTFSVLMNNLYQKASDGKGFLKDNEIQTLKKDEHINIEKFNRLRTEHNNSLLSICMLHQLYSMIEKDLILLNQLCDQWINMSLLKNFGSLIKKGEKNGCEFISRTIEPIILETLLQLCSIQTKEYESISDITELNTQQIIKNIQCLSENIYEMLDEIHTYRNEISISIRDLDIYTLVEPVETKHKQIVKTIQDTTQIMNNITAHEKTLLNK